MFNCEIPNFPKTFHGNSTAKTPCFKLNSNQVVNINEPWDFYNKLKELIATAQKRIVLSTLYLGDGKLEQELVETLHKNLLSRKNLRVKCLFDYSRGQRGKNSNSKTMLQKLISDFDNQFSLHLYHSPKLRGKYNLIKIIGEFLKIFIIYYKRLHVFKN
jgi:CDP-diacylglycerol--glycerol-3-phosphate 3-phosphatidyltransferase